MANPIKFSEFFDFSDSSPLIQAAISDMKALKSAYEDFSKAVIGGGFAQLTQQQSELVASIRSLVDATKLLSITNKEAQQTLSAAAVQMAAYDAAMKQNAATQQALKNIQNAAADSVNGLTAQLNKQVAAYNELDSANAQERKQMQGLADQIRQTRQELKSLTDETQISAEKTKAAADSMNGLQTKLKELKDAFGFLSPSLDGKLLASYALEIQKTEAAIKSLSDATKAVKPVPVAPPAPAGDSIDGLKLKLGGLQQQYNSLSQSAAGYDATSQKLVTDIRQTQAEINTLTNATRTNISTYNAAQGSYNALDIETKQLIKDLKALGDGIGGTNAQADILKKQIADNTDRLKAFDKEIGDSRRNVGNYASAFDGAGESLKNYALGLISITALTAGVKHAFDESLKFDSLQRTLEIVSGNTIEFSTNLNFLRATADKLGLSFDPLVGNFNKFYAAANEAGFGAEKTRGIFDQFAQAFANLRLDPQRVSNAFLALEETISRGTVSSQQLRRQLGTEIPGAFELAAKAVGVTTQELDKMLRKGQVISEDFIPKFANVLQEKFGNAGVAVDGLQAAVSRLSNASNQLYQGAGIRDFFTALVGGAGAVIKAISDTIGFFTQSRTTTIALLGALALLNQSFIAAAATKIADTVALIANTVARLASAAAVGIATAATGIYVAVTEAATGAITVATAAQRIWNIVIAANPIGALITAITIVVAAIAEFTSANEEAIRIETQKKQLTADITTAYNEAAAAIQKINSEIKNFVNLSVQERDALEKEIQLRRDSTAERKKELQARVDLLAQQAKENKPNVVGTFFKAFQYRRTADSTPAERAENAQRSAEAAKITNAFGPQIAALSQEEQQLNEQLDKVEEITQAYTRAMAVNIETSAGMAERQRLLKVAVDNTKHGTQDHIEALRAYNEISKLIAAESDKGLISSFNNEDKKAKAAEAAQKRAEAAAKKAQKDADDLAKAGAAAEIAAADLVYARSQKTAADQLDLEEAKHAINEKYFKLRLSLYDDDSTEYKNILKDEEENTAKYLDRREKIYEDNQKKIAATNKTLQGQATTTLGLSGDLAKSEDALALLDKENEIKKRAAALTISQGEAERELHDLKIRQINEEIERLQALVDASLAGTDDRLKAEKNLADAKKQLAGETADYQISQEQKVQETIGKLRDSAFQFAATAASGYFDLVQAQDESQLAALQKQHDADVTLAGNNAVAKAAIDKKFAQQSAVIKREEAQAQKEGSIFQIGITTAENIVKAYPNPYLIAAAAALGALEIGIVAAKPIPQYFKGRRNGPAELARVNEQGAELIERGSNFYVAGGGKDTLTMLQAGDKVLTHEESVDRIANDYLKSKESDAFLDSILQGQQIYLQSESSLNQQLIRAVTGGNLSKEALTDAFRSAVSDIPIEQNVWDVQGHRRFERRKNSRIEQVHERQTMGGNG